MSRFLTPERRSLVPYTPGEQPKGRQYIKLNTNESPFPPSKRAMDAAALAAERLQLYPDPECRALREALALTLGVAPSEVIVTNGSDEVLNFAFMAFCDEERGAAFPDITYGFYSVFAELNRIPYDEIPLAEDLSVRPSDYRGLGRTIFLANPNAPTGLSLSLGEIEEILEANRETLVVIDEAYIDFGGESAVSLLGRYDNLLVTGTFSKSRSMAGARLGFGVSSEAIIRDLETIRYATNPYNINSMTMAAGLGTLEDADYTKENCRAIVENRAFAADALRALGFTLTDSRANFLFARHERLGGEELYRRLREKGVLVRHFQKPRIADYNRITVGDRAQMETLIEKIREILEETL